MATIKVDEQQINLLYRHYQHNRDPIEYMRYQPIRRASRYLIGHSTEEMLADEQIEAVIIETGVQRVVDAARRMYLTNVPDSISVVSADNPANTSTQKVTSRSSFGRKIFNTVKEQATSLNMGGWVPVATTAMLLLLIITIGLNKPGLKHNGMPEYIASQVSTLQQQEALIRTEINRLNSWQYGFSSNQSEFGKAFTSGVLLIDLFSVSRSTEKDRHTRVLSLLKANVANEIDIDIEDNYHHDKLIVLGKEIELSYYDNRYTSAFILGQWVETSYLLSRLGVKTGDMQGLRTLLTSLPQVIELLEDEQRLDQTLVGDLNNLAALSKSGISAQANLEVSTRLLKLRSTLMFHRS